MISLSCSEERVILSEESSLAERRRSSSLEEDKSFTDLILKLAIASKQPNSAAYFLIIF